MVKIKISDPQQTRNLLQKHGLKLKRSLGQNLLVDSSVLAQIINTANLTKEDTVVEIGAGLGSLTQALAQAAGQVKALELDERLVPILNDLFAAEENVEVIQGDAQEVDFDQLGGSSYKVVANLPYSTANPIIRRLLENDFGVTELMVMVQKEVAERMAAQPGGKDYGILSIGIQYFAEPEIEFVVSPESFVPQPEVESAVIKLKIRDTPPVDVDEDFFFQVVRAAFQQRRKTIRNALSKAANLDLERNLVDKALEKAEIDSRRRGEKLSIDQFAQLSKNLLILLME